jgi:DNA processing protein
MTWAMAATPQTGRPRYRKPERVDRVSLPVLLGGAREVPEAEQARLSLPDGDTVFCVGDQSLVKRRSIALVGSRKVSEDGAKRARKLARQLAEREIVVVSGLAYGVDVNAHQAAIEAGGKTIAVIGTPVDRAYPADHGELQERIYREHLLLTPFPLGAKVFPSNFPQRNKLMAAISDGTVIVEASDTSGSRHQAAECARIGRWLFFLKSMTEDPEVTWWRGFVGEGKKARIVERVEDILNVL